MPKVLQDWERQAVIDAYRDGEKLASIAEEFGVKPVTISMIAKRAGLVRRPRWCKTVLSADS